MNTGVCLCSLSYVAQGVRGDAQRPSWREQHVEVWIGTKAMAVTLFVALVVLAISKADVGAAIVVAVCVSLLAVLVVLNRVSLHREQMEYVRGAQWWAEYQAGKQIEGSKQAVAESTGISEDTSGIDNSVTGPSSAVENVRVSRSRGLRKWARWMAWVSVAGLMLFLIGLAADLWWVWVPGIVLLWLLVPFTFTFAVSFALERPAIASPSAGTGCHPAAHGGLVVQAGQHR